MTSLSLLLHYSIFGLKKNQGKRRLLESIDFSFDLRLNLNDGKVTWMSYLSNMLGKGIFEGLFCPPRFPFILRP